MSVHPDAYDLLKSIIHHSTSSLPIETKLDQMLRSISNAFQSDRCSLLKPDQIDQNGFLSRLALEKKPFWVDEGSSFHKKGVLLEEKDLLCPTFACIPLWDETSFQGILYIGFSKKQKFSPQDVDLLLLIAEEMGTSIRNAQLHQKAEQTIAELTALQEMGKAVTSTFYHKESDPSKFNDRDFQLLLTMANQMSCAIENALAHHEISNIAQQHEKRVQQLSTLCELNKALLTTVNFERILHLTLTAITIGDGLGFNRAMLFLIKGKDNILEGTLAVGPDSPEEAGRIWTALSQRKGTPSDLISHLQLAPEKNSVLNSTVKGIQIPLEQEQCILSRTVLEGRPFNIQLPPSGEEWLQIHCERGCLLDSELGCDMSKHLSRNPRVYSFATVPLWGKGKVIGVILVDNLYNQNPITEEDLHVLGMFSNQAGLAIENAILYRKLEEVHQELKEAQTQLCHHEKMAALGELSTTIAHEIRNPLVSIGGFARRLDRAISDESQEKRYTQTIMKEVSRLEKIFSDILTYIRDESLVFKEYDLRDILEKSLSMISEGFDDGGIHLVKEFAEGLPQVIGDDQQLKQVFFNLITNARQAMNGKGTLTIHIYPISKNGSSFVRVEIKDTGEGIDPENLHNIFNPFFSTGDTSLGLGLPIVHKIVTSHRGQIGVDNHPGKGVTFIVTLPAKED